MQPSPDLFPSWPSLLLASALILQGCASVPSAQVELQDFRERAEHLQEKGLRVGSAVPL